MELLGAYNSSLTAAYYQQLLALLNAAISAGDLSGGSAFDKTTLQTLETQAQNFASLPTGTSGSRVTDDSFNYPLSLLQARLTALQTETNNFTAVSGRLLTILQNETDLIDDLLAADDLSQWQATLPQLLGAWSTAWDFGIGQGPKSPTLSTINPQDGVIVTAELSTGAVFDCSTGLMMEGLLPPSTPRSFSIKSMSWDYTTTGTPQELYAPDMSWTQLDLLESLPRVDFSAPPQVQVILPQGGVSSNMFEFVGNVPGGALPTYVRVLFYPRLNSVSAAVSNGVATTLSAYSIDPNSVVVLSASGAQAYSQTTDFNTDAIGTMTPIDIGTNVPVTIYFIEYWPAYQCSVDQTNWSPIFMLDVNRPYPDNATSYLPLAIQNGRFPLMDETGVPTGLYFRPLQLLTTQYTLLVTTPAGSVYGPPALLELDISQSSFMSAVSVSPYSAFPATLTMVEIEGLTSNTRHTVWSGSFLMEQDTQIQFPRQVVSKIYLTFVQDNYTIKEYQEASSEALRINTMNNLQASLPFAFRTAASVSPAVYRGFQYEWGFENLVALDVQPATPGVFVQGPIMVPGCPEVVRYDSLVGGAVDTYLCYRAYSSSGALLDENLNGVGIPNSGAFVFPFSSGVTRANISSVEIDIRFVLQSWDAIVSRYCFQATLV